MMVMNPTSNSSSGVTVVCAQKTPIIPLPRSAAQEMCIRFNPINPILVNDRSKSEQPAAKDVGNSQPGNGVLVVRAFMAAGRIYVARQALFCHKNAAIGSIL